MTTLGEWLAQPSPQEEDRPGLINRGLTEAGGRVGDIYDFLRKYSPLGAFEQGTEALGFPVKVPDPIGRGIDVLQEERDVLPEAETFGEKAAGVVGSALPDVALAALIGPGTFRAGAGLAGAAPEAIKAGGRALTLGQWLAGESAVSAALAPIEFGTRDPASAAINTVAAPVIGTAIGKGLSRLLGRGAGEAVSETVTPPPTRFNPEVPEVLPPSPTPDLEAFAAQRIAIGAADPTNTLNDLIANGVDPERAIEAIQDPVKAKFLGKYLDAQWGVRTYETEAGRRPLIEGGRSLRKRLENVAKGGIDPAAAGPGIRVVDDLDFFTSDLPPVGVPGVQRLRSVKGGPRKGLRQIEEEAVPMEKFPIGDELTPQLQGGDFTLRPGVRAEIELAPGLKIEADIGTTPAEIRDAAYKQLGKALELGQPERAESILSKLTTGQELAQGIKMARLQMGMIGEAGTPGALSIERHLGAKLTEAMLSTEGRTSGMARSIGSLSDRLGDAVLTNLKGVSAESRGTILLHELGHQVSRQMRRAGDPLYETLAHASQVQPFRHWSKPLEAVWELYGLGNKFRGSPSPHPSWTTPHGSTLEAQLDERVADLLALLSTPEGRAQITPAARRLLKDTFGDIAEPYKPPIGRKGSVLARRPTKPAAVKSELATRLQKMAKIDQAAQQGKPVRVLDHIATGDPKVAEAAREAHTAMQQSVRQTLLRQGVEGAELNETISLVGEAGLRLPPDVNREIAETVESLPPSAARKFIDSLKGKGACPL